MIFKELNLDEVKSFKDWAWDFYKAGDPIDELWHPVIQAECEKINAITHQCEQYDHDIATLEDYE